MDCSSVAQKTCVLKVNLHGPACEKKVHKLLRKINGVSSIAINGEHGKVTVLGNIDPCSLVMALEKVGKNAELLWEDSAPVNCPNQFLHPSQSGELEGIDPKQLQQFSRMGRVKQVEVTNSKCVKLKFKDHESESTQKSNTISMNIDDVGPKDLSERVHHQQKGIDIDDGPCGATSWCHRNCHGHATEKYDNFHIHGSGVSPRAKDVHHEKFYRCGSPRLHRCDPPEPPLAPPYDNYPPPVSYSYSGLYSDDDLHGCRLM